MSVYVLGIDMATRPRKTGYALATYDNDMMNIILVDRCSGKDHNEIPEVLTEHTASDDRVLIAIDAPLGWPEVAGRELLNHRAGQPIPSLPDNLFHRHTDGFVHAQIGKRPLEVGASRIARTAHAALKLIETIRLDTRRQFEVITSIQPKWHDGIIEVYPAATAIVHSQSDGSINRRDSIDTVRVLKNQLSAVPSTDDDARSRNEHERDACLCVLAAQDFIRGAAMSPLAEQRRTASKEGWIWLRGTENASQPAQTTAAL